MKFEDDFKEAIRNLPEKEKDKLLLRLLKKDLKLANRLYFELVSGLTVEEKRKQMTEQIIVQSSKFAKNFYSPGYLNFDVRSLSGEINEYVSTTQDKAGEIELQILLISETLRRNNTILNTKRPPQTQKLYQYLISKVFRIMILMMKQHEDVRFDYKEALEELGNLIAENSGLMQQAIYNGLDLNWLINWEIPENIDEIYKGLRENGLL